MELYESEADDMDRIRQALINGKYPGMGTGDPDLYKAFCWRFWNLCSSEQGHIGVVLPRSALAAKGSTQFRMEMISNSPEIKVTMLLNNRQWVFPEVHPQYTVGLVCVTRGDHDKNLISLDGPFASKEAFLERRSEPSIAFDVDDVLAWNDTVSLPLLPNQDSVGVFAQLRKAPRLDKAPPPPPRNLSNATGYWRARPDREMDATLQKHLMVFDQARQSGEPDPTPNSTLQRRRGS